ncbi:MAG: GNAT family N-acetyltransferase [Flavobacteriales bacterium]|jgi:predicted GNAT family N-acyltransferase|nr:GNAT family N-acetyltransferase [Flavobacteriales bacterium]
MRVRYIKAAETYPLRQQLLRPLQPIDEMDWYGDNADTSFHVGAEVGEELICVASFMLERCEQVLGWRQYRLRGMATQPDQQGSGAGKAVLKFGLDHLRGLKADLVWCNAREKVVGFYGGMGFQAQGELFMVDGIGMHQLMYLRL